MNQLGLDRGFVHLNVDGRWDGFAWHGLELDDHGALALAALPRPSSPPAAALSDALAPDGPAGVVITPNRTLFFNDPERDLLYRLAPCDCAAAPTPCTAGGDEPGRLHRPRGMAYHPVRDALVVADSGNHRLLLLDSVQARVLGVWGEGMAPYSGPSADPGRFDTPWTVAVDQDGYTYVVDYGNRRIQKLDLDGRPVDGFRQRVADSGVLSRPIDLTASSSDRSVQIHVLDADSSAVLVLDADGNLLHSLNDAAPAWAMGIAVDRSGIFIGDNDRRGLMRVLPNGERAGYAPGYNGPVSALALDGDGRLWLHPGSGQAPLPFNPRGAYARSGVLWSDPLAVDQHSHEWHQLRAIGTPPSEGTAIEFYVHLADEQADPGRPAGASSPFPSDWRRLPQRGFHGLVRGSSRYLRVGARFFGDGGGTPRIEQLRVDFDSRTWLDYLPAIYQKDSASRHDLEALLALSESLFCDVEKRSRDLPLYFDPRTVPASWLDWLAGWLGLELPEGWSEARKRAAVARAFDDYGVAGTRSGLREALRLSAGLRSVIEEPIRLAGWWLLTDFAETTGGSRSCGCGCGMHSGPGGIDDASGPSEASLCVAGVEPPRHCGSGAGSCCGEDPFGVEEPVVRGSRLGFSTVLAPAQPDGAIVGTTAIADRSHLTNGANYGAVLFDDVAHRFTVSLYGGPGLTEQKLADVRRVIEREKPAHTDYRICTIEPRMRVGYQAIIGIDTVIAAGAPDRKHPPGGDGGGLRLGGDLTGIVGVRSEVGASTRLG